jgi:hypothetical protein
VDSRDRQERAARIGGAPQGAQLQRHLAEEAVEELPAADPFDALVVEHFQVKQPERGPPLDHSLQVVEVVGKGVELRVLIEQGALQLEERGAEVVSAAGRAAAGHQ